ncbi:hypothetical protein JL722_3367 [Aureococcus anophagefferens]|nr:hypothetical protein JL722_3367 [Aureococcus anophagefferens]
MARRRSVVAALVAAAALVAPASCAPRLALDRSAGRPAAERTATITLGDYRVEDYDDDEESLEGEGPATTIAYEVANATVLTMGATPAATASLDIVAADADGRETRRSLSLSLAVGAMVVLAGATPSSSALPGGGDAALDAPGLGTRSRPARVGDGAAATAATADVVDGLVVAPRCAARARGRRVRRARANGADFGAAAPATFAYAGAPPTLEALSASVGDVVVATGAGFANGTRHVRRVASVGVYVSPGVVHCAVPAEIYAGGASLAVANNGVDFSDALPLVYGGWYAPVAHLEIRPDRGPASGGSAVVLNVAAADRCRFGDAVVFASNGTCAAPPAAAAGAPGGGRAVAVAVSVDGGHSYGRAAASFYYDASAASSRPSRRRRAAAGGETVALTGLGFARSPGLACLFGGVAVAATFRSPTEVTCAAPPLAPGAHCVQLAINGEDADTGCASFHAFAELEAGTVVLVEGNFAGAGDAFCGFGDAIAEAVATDDALSCVVPPSSTYDALRPVAVSLNGRDWHDGGFVAGRGFVGAADAACDFGGVEARATILSSTALACDAPADSKTGAVDVAVVLNGTRYGRGLRFAVRAPMTLLSVAPATFPRRAAPSRPRRARDSRDANLACRFGGGLQTPASRLSDGLVRCEVPPATPGAARFSVVDVDAAETTASLVVTYVAGVAVSALIPAASPKAGGGEVLALLSAPLPDGGDLFCKFGAARGVRHRRRGVTHASTTFTYLGDAAVAALAPSSGPAAGGTVVRVAGADFEDSPTLACRFGSVRAAATFVSPTEISCVAPASASRSRVAVTVTTNGVDFGSSSAFFTFFPSPEIAALTPAFASERGGTWIAVAGAHFEGDAVGCDLDGAALRSVRESPSLLRPPGAAGAVAVSVANNGVDFDDDGPEFLYAAAATVQTFEPRSGSAGTKVTLVVADLPESAAASCRFGTTVVAAARAGATLTCEAPERALGPASLAVSTNGVDWTTADGAFHYASPIKASAIKPPFAALSIAAVDAAGATAWESNALGYYFYEPLRVDGAAPRLGPETGGTVVTVRARFGDLDLTCRVGDTIQAAARLTDALATCVAPPGVAGASGRVGLGANGADFTGDAAFGYHAEAFVDLATPAHGPLTGGTRVDVEGRGFLGGRPFGAVDDARCCFAFEGATACAEPSALTDARITCETPDLSAIVVGASGVAEPSSIAPPVSALAGGTMLVIRGSNLAAPDAATGAPLTSCRFDGRTVVRASSVDAAGELATCVTPDLGLAAPRAVDLEVAANGFDFEKVPAVLYYVPLPRLTGLSHGSVFEQGGIDVAVFGQNFAPTAQLSCRFGASKVVCVEVTINGDDYTSDCAASLAYTARPRVADASPKSSTALLDGVDVTGAAFGGLAKAPGLACSFGGVKRPAYVLDDGAVRCDAPRAPPAGAAGAVALALVDDGGAAVASEALTFYYASPLSISKLGPSRGPARGGTAVVITGDGFDDTARCVFAFADGSEVFAAAKATSPTELVCESPPAGGAAYAVVDVASRAPEDGAPELRTDGVIVLGRGWTASDVVTCRFGAAAPVAGFHIKRGAVVCEAPPNKGGAKVALALALNGVDYEGAGAVTYSYANRPTVASLAPKRGPRGGGTLVTIRGSGFVGDGGVTVCRFGDAPKSRALEATATAVTCVAPPATAAGAGSARVSFNDGADWSDPLCDPSAAAFDYVDDVDVASVAPQSLPAETPTLLYLETSGPVARCRVGVAVGNATADGACLIACRARPGPVPVEVSVDGQTFHDAGHAVLCVAAPKDVDVAPASGGVAGGTVVTVHGVGLGAAPRPCRFGDAVVPAARVEGVGVEAVTCVAPARGPGFVALAVAADADANAWSDAAPFAYYGPEAVDAAVPAVVAVDGTALDITVKLREALPASAAAPRCVFSVAGEPARSTPAAPDGLAVACALPAAFRGAPGTVTVRLAANGVDASASFAEWKSSRPEVLSLAPAPATVEISNGAAAESRDEALLHFVAPLPIAASNAAGTVAGGAVVTLDAAGRLRAYRCRFGADRRGAPGRVDLAAGGGAFCATGLVFEYAASPAVRAVAPAARVRSGDVLKLAGSGFRSTADLRCRVGAAAPSPALWRSSTLVECAVPEGLGEGSHEVGVANNGVDFGDAAAVFVRGDDVTLSFSRGPAAGGTVVTVVGLDRLRRGDEPLLCVLALSLNGGADWSPAPIAAFYAAAARLEALHPPAVAVGDAATVVALGGPFVESTGWTASVGGEAAACSWLNGSALAFVAPPAAVGEHAVALRIHDAAAASGEASLFYEAALVASLAAPDASTRGVATRVRLILDDFAPRLDLPLRVGPRDDFEATPAAVVDGGVECAAPLLGSGDAVDGGRVRAARGPDGDHGASNWLDYAWLPELAITSVSPTKLTAGGGDVVRVRGGPFPRATRRSSSAALGAPGEEVFLPSEDPTFDFHANPVITAIHPAAGTARGGNALVVVGSGFADGGSLEVRLTALDGSASVTAAARFLNASAAVVDELPASPLASGDGSGRVHATATNCGDERDLAPDPASAAVYAYEGALAVTGVAPGAVDAVGGTVVTVSGFGFFPTRPSVLSCKFGTVAVPATFLNETAAACRSPQDLRAGSTIPVAVSLDGEAWVGSVDTYVRVRAAPRMTGVVPSFGPRGRRHDGDLHPFGATLATVYGAHFLDAPTLTCRWGELGTSPATFVAAGELRCATVSAANASSARLTVSNNGVDFGDVGAVARFWPEPSLDAVVPSAGPDSGRRASSCGARASATSRAGDLVCVFGVARRPATWLRGEGDDDAVRCASPPASEAISSKLTAAGGGAVPLRLAPRDADAASETFVTFAYTPRPLVYALTPDHGPTAGGTPVTLTGANLDRAGACGCRFGTHETDCVNRTSTAIVCLAPPASTATDDMAATQGAMVGAGSRVTVEVNVDDARTRWTTDAVEFAYAPAVGLRSLAPLAGPRGGGSRVVVEGDRFPESAGLTCRFGAHAAPATWLGSDRVAATRRRKRRPWPSDVVAVAISTNGGVDYSHALQFSYFAAHISLDAATPARGRRPAACRRSEVACDAPPAPVARDVQRVVVDGRAAVNEIQTIDVVGRKAAQEVQEVRVTAAGGSRREDFVDLSVDLAAGGATAEEQTVTTSLSGHEAEVQRLTLALAPSNREVQTLDVSAFVEAYAYNGSLNCRGYGNPTTPCADEFGGRDYGFSFIFGPYVTEMIWVNASAYEVQLKLEALAPFREGVDVVSDGAGMYVVTFPAAAGDVPLPSANASSKLWRLSRDAATLAINATEDAKGSSPPTQRLEVENAASGFYYLGFEGQWTVAIPHDATAPEVEAALNDILDDDLIGDVAVTALDRYEGRDYAYKIEFVDACRASVSLLDVEDRRLRPTPTDMGHNYNGENFPVARVVDQAADFDTIRGTLVLSLDGELSSSFDVAAGASDVETAVEEIITAFDDTGGLTISDTTVEDVSASYARGCGYVYDVTFPAGRDFSSLVVHPYGLSGAGAYGAAEETTKGSQYEVHELALYGKSGSYFLTYDGSETTSLSANAGPGSVETAIETYLGLDVDVTRTIDGSDAYYKITYTDAVEDGQLAARVRVGGVANVFDSSSASPTYTGTSANLTVFRAGRWSPLSGSFTLGLGGVNVSVPHDATADELAAILSASQPHFGRPTVARSAGDANLETYEWTVTFADVAGVVPEMVAGEGTLTAYGASSVATDTERQASGSVLRRGRALKVRASDYVEAWTRYVDVGATVDELQEAIDDALNGTSLAASVEARASGAATWRVGRTERSPAAGWGDGAVILDVQTLEFAVDGDASLAASSYGVASPGAFGIQRVLLTARRPWRASSASSTPAPARSPSPCTRATTRCAPRWSGRFLRVDVSVDANVDGEGRGWMVTFTGDPGDVPLMGCDKNLSTGLAGPNGTTYPTPSCVVGTSSRAPRERRGLAAARARRLGHTGRNLGASVLHRGDQPLLSVVETRERFLNGTDASYETQELVRGSASGGGFKLRRSYAGWTDTLAYGASEEAVRYALEDGACADVRVNRDAYADASSEGWRYRVTFPACAGNAMNVLGDAAGLTAADAAVRVRETVRGVPAAAPYGSLYLSFRDATTAELGTDASAATTPPPPRSRSPRAYAEKSRAVVAAAGFANYDYLAEERVSLVAPALADGRQGSEIFVLGSFAEFDAASRTCDFHLHAPPSVGLWRRRRGDGVRVRDVTANGVDAALGAATLRYAPPPSATRADPPAGPRAGGTVVRVLTDWNATEKRAADLAGADGLATCDFGGAVVAAAYRSREELECVAPPFEPARAVHTLTVSSAAVTRGAQVLEVALDSATAADASGAFRVELEGVASAWIDINATAAEEGRSWAVHSFAVAFKSREGPVPTFAVDDSRLSTLGAGDAVRAYPVYRGTTGAATAEAQTIEIRQPDAVSEVQRVTLAGSNGRIGREKVRAYIDESSISTSDPYLTYDGVDTAAPTGTRRRTTCARRSRTSRASAASTSRGPSRARGASAGPSRFYNVTVDEVVAGVAPLDGFLVLETTDQYGNQNSSAKLPVASLTPAMIQNALEDAMGAYVAGRHVVVSRTDVDAGVFCDNETSSNEKCRGVDFAITFPATMGDVPLVVSNLTGSTPSARMTATTYSIANGTWAPLGGSFNLTVPGGWANGPCSAATRFDANVTDRPPWTWDPVYGRTYEDADGAFVEPDEPLSGDAAACGVARRAGAGPYVDVKVSANGQDYGASAVSFGYHAPVVLESSTPARGTVDGGTEVSVRLSTMVPVVLNRTITTEGVRHLPRHATAYDSYDEDGLNYDATDDAYFFAASDVGFYRVPGGESADYGVPGPA